MAYGNVVGYEPTQVPGAYQFVDKSGSKWMLTGAPAEDLRKRLDASASLAPQPVAGPGTGVMTPEQRAAWEQKRQAQTQAELGPIANPTPAAPPVPVTAGQPAATSGPQGARSVGAGLYEQDGVVGRFVGPSAGSPGGLELRGETRQGVQPVDPEFLAEQDNLQIDKRLAQQKQSDVALERAEMERQHREEMAVIAANEQAEAARRAQEVETRVADLQGKYDKAEKEVANTKIDPKGGSNFLDNIAMALGAIGATLQKQPNYVAEIVQRKIDRRIAAQERELDVKRETKNDLAKMLEVTSGNRDLARQALNAAYTKKAQATFEARASATGSKEVAATSAMAAAQMQDAYLVRRKAWEDAGRGEVTQSFVNRPAVAASRGGFVPEKDQIGTQSRLVDLEKKKQELAQGPKDSDAKAAGGAEKAKRLSAIKASLVALENFSGKSAAAKAVYATGSLGSKESQAVGAGAGALGPMVARAIEGDAATKDSMDRVVGGLTAVDPAAREATRKAYIEQLKTLQAAIESE